MNTTFCLRLLVILAFAAAVSACKNDNRAQSGQANQRAGQEQATTGRAVNDRDITTRVQAKFFADPQIKKSDVTVNSENGVVTLEGTVPSEAVKQQAVQTAQGVSGVARVEDRLRIQGSGSPEGSGTTGASGQSSPKVHAEDAPKASPGGGESQQQDLGTRLNSGWITTKVQSQFFADPDVKGRNIDVDTVNGIVTLSGTVESDPAHQRAVEIARRT